MWFKIAAMLLQRHFVVFLCMGVSYEWHCSRQMEEREGKRNKYYRLDQTCSVARAEDLTL